MTEQDNELFSDRKGDFPTEYHGIVERVSYDPKYGQYKNPTIIIEVKPEEYTNNQFIFVPVEDDKQPFDKADVKRGVSIHTYTGVFFRSILQAGIPIKKGDNVLDVAMKLRSLRVHAKKANMADVQKMGADKVKGDKWLIVEVSAQKPGTVA